MMSLAYLIVMVLLGDLITRRWFTSDSFAQRLATAFLVGLLVATWLTYLASLLASGMDQPLVAGNAVFIGLVGSVLVLERLRAWRRMPRRADWRAQWMERIHPRAMRLWPWELGFLAGLTAIVTWMAFATFSYGDGVLTVGGHELGDFGANTAIAAGFSIGHNFPTEYPLFAGERSLYHFLFYFQAGNLSFLGWDPALAGNLLFVGSMVSLLVVLMALARRVFRSTAVAVLSAVLFFFHGSLSFIPYLATFDSIDAALQAVPTSGRFLSSIFPYRGEDWAFWTQNVFLNQRHLASAIGLLLVVSLFVIERAMPSTEAARGSALTRVRNDSPIRDQFRRASGAGRAALGDPALPGYLVGGVLLGLLPLWNGAIYVAGAILMGSFLVLFRNRIQMLVMATVAGLISAPQLIYLRPDAAQSTQYPAFHWGFVVTDPSLINVATYIGFLFGPKLLLMAVAVVASTGFQRRLFLGICSLGVVAFTFQLSVDIANNHKILIVWLILGNLYVAFGLVVLWRRSTAFRGRALPALPRYLGRATAVALAGIIVAGGLIDLIPIAHDPPQVMTLRGNRLYEWARDQTDRQSVFLTDVYVHHPILQAGRRLYFGWPANALSMGYAMAPREESYRRLISGSSARDVVRELQAEGIDYVAFDDGLRESEYVSNTNESLYREHFEQVFDDPDNEYRNLAIYRVPTDPDAWQSLPGAAPVDAFTGGAGSEQGRFDAPRGLAVGPDGSISVADTGNDRVQQFGPDGTYIGELGSSGEGPGQFNEPNGVAVDADGRLHVADLADRVQVFDGRTVDDEWRGPESAFYGPRDIAIGGDGSVYVLDQGRARVVRRSPDGSVSTFGSLGTGDGQLNDPTGIATGAGLVVVADPVNRRMVVFSDAGAFVRSIPVEEWGQPFAYPDVAVEPSRGAIYASSPSTGEILEYGLDGQRTGVIRNAETHPGPLEQPSSLVVRPDGAILVIELGANRIAIVRP